MNIAIVGTGYVGLVTGISLGLLGHQVVCFDQLKDKVIKINEGQSPFYEPGMEKQLKQVLKTGNLKATQNLEKAILESDIVIIAVGTPTVNNRINLTYIKQASEEIGRAIKKVKKYYVVAIKSTVLPGVTNEVVRPILEKFSNKKLGEFGLCMNPEFLREGSALDDALHPDRIIIGQIDDKSGKEFAKIYKKVLAPKIFTNLQTAEMTKYAANALFATLISYTNEIARISETIGKVDIIDVWKGVHLDKRLSPLYEKVRIKPGVLNYILSGCGYGGSCLPKDTKALMNFADKQGIRPQLLKSVIDINKTQPHRVIILLKEALNGKLKGKKIAILGLAFKPGTADVRESPAFPIIQELLSEGARVIIHDPKAYQKNVPKELANLPVVLASTTKDALTDTTGAIIVTAWKEYVKLPPRFFKQNMKHPIVIDGRRIYDKTSFFRAGIIYRGIGLS